MKRAHHELLVWQEAMEFVEIVYQATAEFPDQERFGLTAQMQRAAVSVPSNIAQRLGYISSLEQITNHMDSVFKLMNGLINSLRKRVSE